MQALPEQTIPKLYGGTECPAAEASLHILTLYHQCNGPVLLMWGRRTGTGLGLPSHNILWDCTGSLGETVKRSIDAPPT